MTVTVEPQGAHRPGSVGPSHVGRPGVVGDDDAGLLQHCVVDPERNAIEADRIGVQLLGPLHLGRPRHDDRLAAGRLQAAHELRESRPAAVQELHLAVRERADQHEAPGLHALRGQQRPRLLALGFADRHVDVCRRLGLDAKEIAGQLPILHQRVPARTTRVAAAHQPGPAITGMALRLEAGQARIQRGREGVGKQQRVGALVETPVFLTQAAPQRTQLCDALAQCGRSHMQRPALGLEQPARPALAHQLQPVAVLLQQPQRGQAQHRVADEVAQAHDQGSGFYHRQFLQSGAGFCQRSLHDQPALLGRCDRRP
jgi:hypothetical protein